MLSWYSFALILLPSAVFGFNLNLNQTVTLVGKEDVHFGLSFSLFDSEVFVGAPGDKNGIGSVFHCSLASQRKDIDCIRIEQDVTLGFEAANLGASMTRIQSSTYVCAPLVKRDRYRSIQNNMGQCFKASSEGMINYFTLKSSRAKMYKSGNFDGWRTVSIMGTSLSSTTFGELVIGLPLARSQDFDWDTERVTGSMGVVRFFGRRNFLVPKPDRVPWGSPSHATEDDPRGRDLTGVSIARGLFFKHSKDDYAVGAPKSNKFKGRVYICRSCFDETLTSITNVEREKLILEGEQIGSRFGQAVISVDLDGNGFDDIVVGAPLYSHDENKYDSGEVYIYRTVGLFFSPEFQRMKFIELQRNIVAGAQFGATLCNLGDIDGDGAEDFLVGAPFEEEKGAVYLYRGNADFQIKDYSQKITPQMINMPLMKGFGYSFSNVADVDGNGTPDFVIGALHSDKAALIRTHKVARIFPKSTFRGDKLIEPSDNAFKLSICAILDKRADTNFKITITMLEMDERIQYPIPSPESFILNFDEKEACGLVNITSKIPNFGVNEETMSEIPKPLKLRANLIWEVYEPNIHSVNSTILSPESITNEINVAYNVELKSICHGRACHCQLVLSSSSAINNVVGAEPNLYLLFNLANKGSEPAFNIMVFITANTPKLLLNEESSRLCQQLPSDKIGFECNLGYLKSGTDKDYAIGFDVSQLENYISEDFTLQVVIHPSCSEATIPPFKEILVEARYDYEILLHNHVEEPDLDYEENIERPFSHVFRIQNTGPSPLDTNLDFEIGIPISPHLNNSKTLLTFDENQVTCHPAREGQQSVPEVPFEVIEGSKRVACDTEDDCLHFFCSLPKGIPPGTYNLFIQLVFDIDSSKTDHTESYQIITFLNIPKLEKATIASTNFDSLHRAQIKYLYEFVLPLAAGLILGVILLIVLFCILWKTGAFSKMRIYKNKLKEAEEETAMFVGTPYPTTNE